MYWVFLLHLKLGGLNKSVSGMYLDFMLALYKVTANMII